MKNPWKKIGTKHIYENDWICLDEDQVINVSGSKGIYGKVHFKNKALGIIPLDQNFNTWIVGQYRYPLDEYSWEIPMGGGPIHVDVLDSAKRELKEETGLTANTWTNVMRIHTSNSVTDEEGFVFVAQGLTEGETSFDETEDLTVRKLPFGNVFEMVMNQEITDSLSVAGILKTKWLIDQNRL